MIHMMTAYTEEVDEIDDALAEIFGQIDLGALQKNSVGLITCHFDFTGSGLLKELCARLPFDVIGMTTMASANRHGFGMYALSLTVLTSDDVFFQAVSTAPLASGGCHQEIAAAYTRAREKLPGPPVMALGFFPYISTVSGAEMVSSLDRASGGVPVWGSLATNITVDFEKCRAFHNGGSEPNILAMVLIHGPLEPDFLLVSIPRQKIRENRGMITRASGCVIQEINGMPALAYFEKMGVTIKEASIVTPLMVYYEGAVEPVALGAYMVNSDGSLVCGGETPAGTTIAVGEITPEGIISTAGECINRMLASGRKNGALLLPCVTRYVTLAPNQNSEMERIAELIGDSMPYALGYSGGEVCPVRDESGTWRNRFHNYTFSACVF